MKRREIKQDVLAGHVKRELEEMIINGELNPGDKLESELVLADMFGVSRVTLREALKIMENDGLITKKNGVGTFISMPNPFISGRLEVDFSLSDAAGAAGMALETINVDCSFREATGREIKRLSLCDGAMVACFRRKRYMNDKCIALSYDVMSAAIVNQEKAAELKGRSLYRFLENELGHTLESGEAELSASIATESLAGEMEIEVGSPLLRIDQVDYDSKGGPLLMSAEYYNSRRFKFKVKRHRNMEQYALEYLNQ